MLFNNQIYGLTKGQYSPTSEPGKVTKSTPFGSVDQPFNPISLALGAEATFVARTHDLDRKHMMETFRRAYQHRGAAFVEVYQNCNVFNDGAFDTILAKEARPDNLIPLVHGEPIRFGPDEEKGVMLDGQGRAMIVDVADVGEERILVHDEQRQEPGLAFMLSRLARGPYEPTPIGVFRAVDRPDYGSQVQQQLVQASEKRGPGRPGRPAFSPARPGRCTSVTEPCSAGAPATTRVSRPLAATTARAAVRARHQERPVRRAGTSGSRPRPRRSSPGRRSCAGTG